MDKQTEEQMKGALAAGDFAEAQRLLPVYSSALVTCLSTPCTREEHEQAVESFRNLLSLARVMRAHVSAQLSNLQRQSFYQHQLSSPDTHSWRFEA
jgi:hypothetical protein